MSGLFGKKQTINNTETKLGALRIQNSSQGLPVPLVFGKTRISSNLLWYGDFTAIPHTSTSQSGGKGGGSTTTNSTSYTYTTGVIFGLCEGPVFQSNFIGTVWSNKDVTDATKLGLSEFTGDYSQAPWTYLTTNHANQALNYRGDCYAATGAFDLGDNDGLPNLSFEVTGFLGNGDVNPADITTLLLTADKYGVGWPADQLGDLSNYRAYCAAAGFLFSPAYTTQTPMSQMLSDMLQVTNSACIWSDGLLKIIPYADTQVGTYMPDLTIQYDLTCDDFIADVGTDPVKVSRTRQADAYNSVKIECLDRSNQYNTAVVEAKDQLAIGLYGLRPMSQISAHAICDTDVARLVAQAILQRALYVRNTYAFTVGWRYGRLEPMDIVTLTDPHQNLVKQTVRIVSIEEDENGKLAMTAEEVNIGVSSPGSYSTQTSNGATPQNNVPPGNAAAPVMFQPPIALSATPQIWIGSAGGPNWGGAEVWASSNNTTFQKVGVLASPARFGTLAANFPSVADPDTSSTLQVDLTTSNGVLVAGANSAADQLQTLSWIAGNNPASGELIAYSTANMTSAYHFSMGNYIRRGQVGSNVAAHLTGTAFMRLDEAVGAFDVSSALFGTTIYVKLLSYNTTGGALQELSDVTSYSLALQTQVVTNGNGYPYFADRTSTANTPASGNIRFDNASQAFAGHVYFHDVDAQGANLATFFSSVGSMGYLDLRDVADSNKWATYTIISATAANTVQTFGIVYKAGGAEFPTGDTIVATFSPTPPTGVVSVGLSLPASLFSVANSPVTGNGTLTANLVTQNAATFWGGPATGNAALPAFRAIASTDVPFDLTQSPAFNSALTIDTTKGRVVYVAALTGNMTLDLSGNRPLTTVAVQQDANGSHSLTAGTSIDFGTDITSFANISLTANAYTWLGFAYHPTTGKYRCVSISK